MAYPDKEIVGIEGLGFDYLDLKCGTIEQAAALTDEKDPACSSARILGKVCGCPVPETGCNLCGAGNAISNPYGECQMGVGKRASHNNELTTTTVIK